MELDPNQMPNVHAVQQEQVGAAWTNGDGWEMFDGIDQASELVREQSRRASAIQHAVRQQRSGSPEPYKRRVSVKRRWDGVTVGDDWDSVSHTIPVAAAVPPPHDFRNWVDAMWAHGNRMEQRHRGLHSSPALFEQLGMDASDEQYIDHFRNTIYARAPGGDRRREKPRRANAIRGGVAGMYPSARGSSGVGNWATHWRYDPQRNHVNPRDGFIGYFPQYPGFYRGFGPYS